METKLLIGLAVIFALLIAGCTLFTDKSAGEFEETIGANDRNQNSIITIDSTGNVGSYSSMAINGLNIYISYLDSTNLNLKFAKSTDGGATWPAGNIKTIDSGVNISSESSIAVNDSNIHISYYDSTNGDLKSARSTDGGATWPAGNIKTVESDIGGVLVGSYTSIEIDGSYIYISYLDSKNKDLKFARSKDSGATWPAGIIRTVDSNGSTGYFNSMAMNGSSIYISYYDGTNEDLKFAKSVDYGVTWQVDNIKTVDSSGIIGYNTSISISNSNIYISYRDDLNNNLKFAKSTDSGVTWPPGNIKTVDSSGNVENQNSIAADGSNIYISYYDGTNGDLKFARSANSGNSW